jgi:uncharacterized protein
LKASFTISKTQAKQIALHAQGLLHVLKNTNTQQTLHAIEHLGYVQIDTISVIERAHHHTLWARNAGFKSNHIDVLLSEKKIFEYWSHAASYLPMRDFRFSLLRKKEYAEGKSHWFAQDKKTKKWVLDKLKADGPLQSKDFDSNQKSSGWYNWKPAKKALEQLFMEGEIMVAKRKGFQKVYDLSQNVLPEDVNLQIPTSKEFAQYLIHQTIRSQGIFRAEEVYYLQNKYKADTNHLLKQMLENKELVMVSVKDAEGVFYTTPQHLELMVTKNKQSSLHILSPFDNAVIQRKRIFNLFDFDYTIECYLPQHRRKYGYFSLPIVYNNNFVARLDAKADKKQSQFILNQFHLESDFVAAPMFYKLLCKKLNEFALFNTCTRIVIDNLKPQQRQLLKPYLKVL